ncbi:MAG TPA: ATP-grasp domain-containing protein [Tepidisphaeraceae bacterium]|jgi:hypothetical protein|nr:ATP-grasp domain-containing protein [Tepidisphaeraceae bacterium]
MPTHFLFSAHPLRASLVEEMFGDQYGAVQAAGFTASVCPDAALRAARPLRDIPAGATIVYRGWMLNAGDYARLAGAVGDAGAGLLTSPAAYLAAHHLPNWYPLIEAFTPETRVLTMGDDLEVQLRSLGWDAFFIKDYVKSIKTSDGSIIRDPSQIGHVVSEMERLRGEVEGGLCVRRVEPFVAKTERRYFVLQGKAFGPDDEPVPELVAQVAERIPSPFFSVDVVVRTDGALRIVEVGDGQVSDLVGWSAERFAAIWPRTSEAAG